MRHLLHKAICWYLRRCAGAFHCYNYGDTGRYVVLMSDAEYHYHQKCEGLLRNVIATHEATKAAMAKLNAVQAERAGAEQLSAEEVAKNETQEKGMA